MNLEPLIWTWDGEALYPLPRFVKAADREFVIGEQYRLSPVEERSLASHNQYFARIHDLWMSLPDHLATDFPTDTVLRKHALCMTGFRHERKFVASSAEEARKLAAFIRPAFMDDDTYRIISVNKNVVVEWTPMSQSYRAMPEKGQFQRSKTAVLDWIENLLGMEKESAA